MDAALWFVAGLVALPLLCLLVLGLDYVTEGRQVQAEKGPRWAIHCGGHQRRIWTTIHAESDELAAEAVVALMEREEA